MNILLGSGLLAASMFLGQAGDPPAAKAVLQPPAAQQPAPSRPILNWFSRDERPVMSKLTGWFKRDQKEAPKDGPFIQPAKSTVQPATPTPATTPTTPSSTDFPRKLPNPSSQAKKTTENLALQKPIPESKEVQQVVLQQTVAPKGGKSPILPQIANKIGRDEKFEWITGQLEIENGNHVLYYATPETVDKYHGRIVLVPQQVDMTQFRKGDLVSVRGTVAQRQTTQGMVTIYRLSMASMIERPKGL